MRNVHRAVITIFLLLTSGWGCATAPQKANLPPTEEGPGEKLKQLITLMQTPSEPRKTGVPVTAPPSSSSTGDGGPGATYKHLLTLMETPAVNRHAVTSKAFAPEPPPSIPSTPPATVMAALPPPVESQEVAQTPSPAVLPPSPKEEARTLEVAPSPSYRMETAVINLGEQTPISSDPLRSKEEKLFTKKLYRIGPEDVLRVSVWENPELTMEVTVRPDGNISLPLIKEIHAADLTPMELSDVITKSLQLYIIDPHVTVIVTQTNSPKIYLVGNVLRPGSYPLRQDMTVLQALSIAGGFTIFASPRNMKVIRGTGVARETRIINYFKMIEDIEQGDYMLKPGDTIIVP
jgi:polysaccharide export outer membrane protein